MREILDKFQNLGRYQNSAPHKPLLVLAVLDWVEELKLEKNEIPIDTGLYDLFDKYWDKLYDPNKTGQVLQACHIAPFSETGNNGVRNGIVLCANLHAAFDNGFVGIGEDYEILVNDSLFEERPSIYSIDKLRGERIWLPKENRLWPSQELLAKHRKTHFG